KFFALILQFTGKSLLHRKCRNTRLWRPPDHRSSIVIPSAADTSATLHRPPRLGPPRKPFALVPETTFRAHPYRQSRNTCLGRSTADESRIVILSTSGT